MVQWMVDEPPRPTAREAIADCFGVVYGLAMLLVDYLEAGIARLRCSEYMSGQRSIASDIAVAAVVIPNLMLFATYKLCAEFMSNGLRAIFGE